MTLLTTTGAPILAPEIVGPLVLQPVQAKSIGMRVSQVVQTTSHVFRIPQLVSDGEGAAWTPEGQEIAPGTPDLNSIDVVPAKLAALTICSRELVQDASKEATSVVGQALSNDISAKLDSAFFGSAVQYGPSGIASVVGAHPVTSAFDDLDGFAEAQSLIETAGANVTAFITSPAVALKLATLKKQDNNIEPLLSNDPSSPTKRSVYGVPLFVSPYVEADTAWAVDGSRIFVVLHGSVELAVDQSAYFSSDRIGIRCTLRAGLGFAHPASIARIAGGS